MSRARSYAQYTKREEHWQVERERKYQRNPQDTLATCKWDTHVYALNLIFVTRSY